MNILIARIAKGGNDWSDRAVAQWFKRMRKPFVCAEKHWKPAPDNKNLDHRREQESQIILKHLKAGDVLIALDERGTMQTTDQFAQIMERFLNQGTKRVVFAIGGPYGHHQKLRDRAQHVLALSPMILNHELARMLLVEQIYRVQDLHFGGRYHHV